MCKSGNVSDTGSLFDYAEEEESSFKESGEASNCDNIVLEEHKFDINEIKSEESADNSLEIQSINENKSFEKCNDVHKDDLPDQDPDIKFDIRSATPEATAEVVSESQISVTPENRINFLQNVLKDSIKKSHKKIKDDNKKKLFSPKFLRSKFETVNSKQDESEEASAEHKEERATTPERVNSSRLLLSQFSSVKKSHKKDKHNKILSGFLKRQEYFNKDMDACQRDADNSFECKNTADVSSDFDNTEVKDAASFTSLHDTPLIKLSPSKRRRSLNVSLDYEPNVSYDSDLQEADSSKEEFKIFTPLKRKRSIVGSGVKEYLHFYDLPSGKNEVSEDLAADIGLSRCLTPVPNFQDNCVKTDEDDVEAKKCDSTDVNGRSTPRDMPTTELYVNIDSIKRSHKKNKRANSSWKGFGLFKNDSYMEEKEQASMKSIKVEALESSSDCITLDDVNESIDHDGQLEVSTDSICKEESASVSTKDAPSNVTPPNCLKSKNYMRLIQETSIKRSHKKVRDKKKQELIVDASELSDDGSIFGEEEKLACDEDQSIKD